MSFQKVVHTLIAVSNSFKISWICVPNNAIEQFTLLFASIPFDIIDT